MKKVKEKDGREAELWNKVEEGSREIKNYKNKIAELSDRVAADSEVIEDQRELIGKIYEENQLKENLWRDQKLKIAELVERIKKFQTTIQSHKERIEELKKIGTTRNSVHNTAKIAEVRFADPMPVSSPSECTWYHYLTWPDGSVTRGKWDYRGKESDFLGRLDYQGRKVLEVGPASGYLTKEMSLRGAQVTCVDVSDDAPWDIVPRLDIEVPVFTRNRQLGVNALRRSWWYTQQQFKTNARIAYIGASAIGALRDQFDVGLVGGILQHLRDPITFLYTIAGLVQNLVVTERFIARVERQGGAQFLPSPENDVVGSWWLLSSNLVEQVVRTAGFEKIDHYETSYRSWRLTTDSDGTDEKEDMNFYTSVFKRSQEIQPRAPRLGARVGARRQVD